MFGETFLSLRGGKGVTRCIGQTGLSRKPFTKGCGRVSSSKSLLSASAKFLSTSRVHDLTSWRIDRSVESLALRQKFHFSRKTNIWNQSTRRSLILSPVSCVSYSPLVKINSYLRLADTPRYGFVNINWLVLFGGVSVGGGLLTPRGWWNWLTILSGCSLESLDSARFASTLIRRVSLERRSRRL